MNKAQLTRLVRDTYEYWHGADSWAKASNWRKHDWRVFIENVLSHIDGPQLPSQEPTPPQPFRPYRADAGDENPED